LTLKAGVLFVVTGFAIIMYFREEKARLERKRIAEQTKGIGKPKVGGPFKLVDHNGKEFTDKDMRDKYGLVSFLMGMTHKRGRTNENYATGVLWLHALSRYLP